jgi:hypothetical protein
LQVSLVLGRLAHLPNFKEEEDDEDEDDFSDGSHPAPGDGGHDDHLVELEGGVHDKVVHVLLGFLEVVAQLEVEEGVGSFHISGSLHFDRVLGSFVDEQEVEGVVSRGVHHILLQPDVDSSNCEELVPACVRLGDGDPLSLGDVSAFLSPSIHLAGKLTCPGSHVDAVACGLCGQVWRSFDTRLLYS